LPDRSKDLRDENPVRDGKMLLFNLLNDRSKDLIRDESPLRIDKMLLFN
jgi:hypothetical protein